MSEGNFHDNEHWLSRARATPSCFSGWNHSASAAPDITIRLNMLATPLFKHSIVWIYRQTPRPTILSDWKRWQPLFSNIPSDWIYWQTPRPTILSDWKRWQPLFSNIPSVSVCWQWVKNYRNAVILSIAQGCRR